MAHDVQEIVAAVLEQLEKGWNQADGKAYAAPFAEDADFVDIRGGYHKSREAISAGHQQIFDTIYRGSVVRNELLQARMVSDQAILAHVQHSMKAPMGPLAGEHSATASMLLTSAHGGWQIVAYHNTLQTQ